MKKTVVLGIGNVLMGDEGIGVHVVRWLQEHAPEMPAEAVDGGTGSFYLLEYFHNYDRVILLDATLDGQPPGTVTVLKPQFSSDYPPTLTAHDIGLKDLLDALYISNKQPEIILFAISIARLDKVTLDLTETMRDRVAPIARQVLDFLAQ